MGYMDFNGVRYMDVRERSQYYFPLRSIGSGVLLSDST